MIQITSVETVSDFRLVLTFSSGKRRCVDMRSSMHYPVFRRLENPAFLDLARADYGTVAWPGEIDIAPETLPEGSVTLDAARAECAEE